MEEKEEILERVMKLKDQGFSIHQISKQIGIPDKSLRRKIRDFNENLYEQLTASRKRRKRLALEKKMKENQNLRSVLLKGKEKRKRKYIVSLSLMKSKKLIDSRYPVDFDFNPIAKIIHDYYVQNETEPIPPTNIISAVMTYVSLKWIYNLTQKEVGKLFSVSTPTLRKFKNKWFLA